MSRGRKGRTRETSQFGRNVHIVKRNGALEIGQGSYVNSGTRIRCVDANIVIGENVSIGYDCHLITAYGTHFVNGKSRDKTGDIVIGNHAWLGNCAMIRGGVTIGEWAVVGMGAVVVDDVPPYMVVVGNPARQTGRRPDFTESQ